MYVFLKMTRWMTYQVTCQMDAVDRCRSGTRDGHVELYDRIYENKEVRIFKSHVRFKRVRYDGIRRETEVGS